VTTNVWTIGQQLLIRARMPATLGPPPPPKEGKKRSRFMEAYLQAQEKAAQQREARVGQGDGATRPAKTGAGKTGAKAGTVSSARSTKKSGKGTASGATQKRRPKR
jgi:hypothetical protein